MFHGELDFDREAEGVNQLLLNSGAFREGTDAYCKWLKHKWFDTPALTKSIPQNEA